jgi:pyridoxine 5-phosphate synthase
MASLTVVVDHVASMRHRMQSDSPDPVAAAVIAQLAGADGIAVHMREDHQPIQERDLRLLRNTVHGRFVMHMAPTSEMVGYALEIKPQRVILMPSLGEAPSGNGLDLIVHSKSIFETVDTLQSNGISVGVCVSAEPEQAKLTHQIRADWVQIHAGRLRSASSPATQSRELDRLIDTVKIAHKLRLRVAVGHGLDFGLIKLFRGVPEIDEFSVGQSLIARALLKGLNEAIKEMIETMRNL